MREFIDKDHDNVDEFYDLIDAEHSVTDVLTVIKKDPDFLDPYFYVSDLLREDGFASEADAIEQKAFVRALAMILDVDGTWPDQLAWGFHENRHIIRALMRKADHEWQQGNADNALTLYKNLLKTNLSDNIGARYAIIGIKNGLTYTQYMEQVWPSDTVPAGQIDSWFKKHAPAAETELAEWKQYCIDEIGLSEDEIM